MLFAIVPTHIKGVRRPRDEMAGAQRLTGILTVEQFRHGPQARPMLAAYLTDAEDRYKRQVMPPLFDARLIKMTAEGLLLVGFEICAQRDTANPEAGLVASEYAQGWWAKLVAN